MRARNIKPGFFKNAELAELPFQVRLLFAGLWCLADRKGRLFDRPKQIKGEIFPYDSITPADVSTMLAQLQHGVFILRYERDQNSYIQITNFEKHQYPHIKEQDSTIPAPYKTRASTVLKRLNPDVLNPSSLNPESPYPAGLDLAGVFDSVWREYPKRLGRKEALRHFNTSVKTEVDVKAIRVALAKYKNHVKNKERQYIQHGSTWFNNWRDWVDFEEGQNGPNDSTSHIDLKSLARTAREAKRAREDAATGTVPGGVRDLQDVQPEAADSTGGPNT